MKRGKRERIAKRFGTTRLRPWGLLAVTCWLMAWASPSVSPATAAAPDGLRLGVFAVDASPAIGTQLAYDTCIEVLDPLSCRGVVLQGAGKPIVLVAVDWLGIANEAHHEFCKRLAEAAGTDIERVSVHVLHQHDAPRCDFTAASLLAHYGDTFPHYDVPGARDLFQRAAAAVAEASRDAQPIDGIGWGKAKVERVASNRRILGDNGRVAVTRFTATRDPQVRALPTGTIDPWLRLIRFYRQDQTVAVLSYYATHPQSYYRTGKANPDFPGYARNARQAETDVPHIHFNGAGGNIGAGKWNDGAPANRARLAGRVAAAMEQAFAAADRQPLPPAMVGWDSEAVTLPRGAHLQEEPLVATLTDPQASRSERVTAAKHLAWLRQTEAGKTIALGCLRIGPVRVLHMPGELFVEYQLAAQRMRPELFVAMAAYGEYGPGYIGTEVAYSQGGYETSGRASRVAPGAEAVLHRAMRRLLEVPATAETSE